MFYMCMVQERIGSRQSAVDVPSANTHNKGPGDLIPKFHKHQLLAWSPASTVTSKARACLLVRLALSRRGGGCGGVGVSLEQWLHHLI